MPRALLWFRVLLRTRALLALIIWEAAARCRAALDDLGHTLSLARRRRVLHRWRAWVGRQLATVVGWDASARHLRSLRGRAYLHALQGHAQVALTTCIAARAVARSRVSRHFTCWCRAVSAHEALQCAHGRACVLRRRAQRTAAWRYWCFHAAERASIAAMDGLAAVAATHTCLHLTCERWRHTTAAAGQWRTRVHTAFALIACRGLAVGLAKWHVWLAREGAIAAYKQLELVMLSRRRARALKSWRSRHRIDDTRARNSEAAQAAQRFRQQRGMRRWRAVARTRRRLHSTTWLCGARRAQVGVSETFRGWATSSRAPKRVRAVGRLLMRAAHEVWRVAAMKRSTAWRLRHAASCHAWWSALLHAWAEWAKIAQLCAALSHRRVALRRRALLWRVPRLLAEAWGAWCGRRMATIEAARCLRRSLAHAHFRGTAAAWSAWLSLCGRDRSAVARLAEASASARLILPPNRRGVPERRARVLRSGVLPRACATSLGSHGPPPAGSFTAAHDSQPRPTATYGIPAPKAVAPGGEQPSRRTDPLLDQIVMLRLSMAPAGPPLSLKPVGGLDSCF